MKVGLHSGQVKVGVYYRSRNSSLGLIIMDIFFKCTLMEFCLCFSRGSCFFASAGSL